MNDQSSPESVRAIDVAVMAELTRQQEAGVKYLVGLNVDDLVAAIAAALTAGIAQRPDREAIAKAIHDGLGGDGWAYSNYGGDEWNDKRGTLLAAADAVIALSDTSTDGEAGK